MNCEDEEVCLKPLIEPVLQSESQTKSKCTQCTDEPYVSVCEDKEDCQGCVHCETESDTESDSETESDSDSHNDSDNDSTDLNSEEDLKEDFTRKFKHVINYFLATTDVLENRIKNSNVIMFATVAPLYIGMAFLFGSLYGH
jgi:hypothetical protein